jgi:uncharacterized iron-regulated membrane protein
LRIGRQEPREKSIQPCALAILYLGTITFFFFVGGAGKRAPGEVNFADAQRRLMVDQYSGTILYIRDPHRLTAGEKFLEWQYPLHCGEAFGNTGRAFIMVLGLVPLTLYVTGFLRWRQKQQASHMRCTM